jgi:drug/metabolite transporter superfamily protein YnfA
MMNHVRGVLMLIAGCFALWRGWKIHTGSYALTAYALGVVALGLGVWHLTRKQPQRLR